MDTNSRSSLARAANAGKPKPKFYGPKNVSKLPDPRLLARASTESLKGITAASTIKASRYPK